ncbi:uridine kinase [Paenarthrobacter aurescens]|jgi:uridine kinase|nr:uridine kinase [Paenarthrobacter aurescens]
MTGVSPGGARDSFLRSLAREILALQKGRRLIAIDGVDGSGKSTFARDLAAVIHERPVLIIHVDDFLHLREVRHRRGRDSPEGFWLDTYDYESLHNHVLEPLGKGGAGAYRPAATDHVRNIRLSPALVQAPENVLVLVEGMFLHRDELVGTWDYSIFLDVPFHETARRMALRDGSHPDPEHPSMLRYVGGQRLYFKSAQPWNRATRVVDNSKPEAPRILFPVETRD